MPPVQLAIRRQGSQLVAPQRTAATRILAQEGLTCSVGVAQTKLLAKMASDFMKPDGLTVVKPEQQKKFMHEMGVKKLFGIGPKTEEALAEIGIKTIGELAEAKKEFLMTKEEKDKFDLLPKRITIYRGLQDKKAKIKSLSWTLSEDKAKWFASRFRGEIKVYKAEIDKEDVFMYTNDRNEEEVVINPNKLREGLVVKLANEDEDIGIHNGARNFFKFRGLKYLDKKCLFPVPKTQY